MKDFDTDRKNWILIFLICLAVAALYWRTLDYPPVGWDDVLVEGSVASRTGGFSYEYFEDAFTPHNLSSYQPLRNISRDFLASISSAGDWRFYHAFNILIYLLTLPFFFLTIKNIFSRLHPDDKHKNWIWAPVVGTALFAFHPLHAEVVAWVGGQKDVLVGLFYVLSIYFYTRSRKLSGWETVGSVICYFLALGSKPSAVSLALVLPVYDLYFRKDSYARKNMPRQLVIGLIYILPALMAGLFFIGTSAGVGRLSTPGNPLARFVDIAGAVSFMFEKFLFPVNLVLRYPEFGTGVLFSAGNLARVAVFIAAIYACAWSWKRKNPLAFFLVWALLALAPNANIIPIRIERADRYLYLSSMGLSAGAAYLMAMVVSMSGRYRRVSSAVVISVIAALSVLSFTQAGYWKNGLSAWSRVVEIYPELTIGKIGYGKSLIRAEEYDKAEELYLPLIEKSPPNTEALRDMAYIMSLRSKPEKSRQLLEQASLLDPRNDETSIMLAEAYLTLGMVDKANGLARNLVHSDSTDYRKWAIFGKTQEAEKEYGGSATSFNEAYRLSGEPVFLARSAYSSYLAGDTLTAKEALTELESKKALNGESLETRLLAASTYTGLGMRDKAFDLYASMEFEQLDPAGLEFLGALHFSKGSMELARMMFERVTELNPSLPTGWNNAGVVAESAGDLVVADSFYKKALELAPGYLDANFNRGNLFKSRGNPDSARYYYQMADSIAAGNDQQVRRALDEIGSRN